MVKAAVGLASHDRATNVVIVGGPHHIADLRG